MKDLMKESTTANQNQSILWTKVFNEVFTEGFVSSKELKERFRVVFTKYGIDRTPKATIIEECRLYDVISTRIRINGKQVRGYELARLRK